MTVAELVKQLEENARIFCERVEQAAREHEKA